jgi:hypothetical protein
VSDGTPATDRLAPLWWLWLPLAFLAMALVTANLWPAFYERWIDGEHGVMESLQALHTFIGLLVALSAIPLARARRRPWLVAYLALAALACFYVTGEEISWGQHFFGWSTPEDWAEINDQGETNLHNLGALWNEVPRHILSAGVLLGGLLVPLLALRWPLRAGRLGIVLPPACLWLTALLSAVGGLLREKDWLGGLELLPRASEVQESFLFWFVLLYLIVLKRRIRAL